MGLDHPDKSGKRQARFIEARPLRLCLGPAEGDQLTPVSHLDQQRAAFRPAEGAIETVEPPPRRTTVLALRRACPI